MKLILDENIIEFAARCTNSKEAACGTLLGLILKNCDMLICNKKLYKSYLNRLKKLEHIGSSIYVAKILSHIQSKGSINFIEYSPPLYKEDSIPFDDIFLIRLAVHTNSILVSNDGRLKDSLIDSNLINIYNLVFKFPSEVY